MVNAVRVSCGTAILCGLLTTTGFGQWIEQSFELKPGWNTVFLEVDPATADADDLFGELPISMVWMRDKPPLAQAVPQDCVGPNDTNCTPTENDRWRVWVPIDSPNRPAHDLRIIPGNSAYFIKVTQPTTLTVVGKPSPTIQSWQSGYNLVGFHVDPVDPPTIGKYLEPAPALAGARVFIRNATGTLSELADPTSTPANSGSAYWIKASATSDYDGPLDIDIASLVGIDFGRMQNEHALTIENRTASERGVSINYIPSGSVPVDDESLPQKAGDVPVLWQKVVPEAPVGGLFQWTAFSQTPYSDTFSPLGAVGSSHTVTLGVDRLATGAVATLTESDDGIASSYQGLLTLRDGMGFRRLIPVTAEVTAAGTNNGNPHGAVAVASLTPANGLWIGEVSVNKVAWTTADAETWTNPEVVSCGCENGFCQNTPDAVNDELPCSSDPSVCQCPDPDLAPSLDRDIATLRPTSSAFTIPVIIHQADDATTTLLTEVTMLFEPTEPGGSDGIHVLATPACVDCDQLEPPHTRSGQPFAPRISTAGYAFNDDTDLVMNLAGGFGEPDATLTAVIVLEPNAPLNPFRHSYHPDHDCDNAGECLKITRIMQFTFGAQPTPADDPASFGFNALSGEYLETVTITARPASPCGCDPSGVCAGGATNDGSTCTDDIDCACPPPTCVCDTNSNQCVGGAGDGQACYDDRHCGCEDQRRYTTQAGGTFQLNRVSDIGTLNDVAGN